MDNDQIKGQWKQLKGRMKSHWGELTDDDVMTQEGDSDYLSGRLQERYGVAKDKARGMINDFLSGVNK